MRSGRGGEAVRGERARRPPHKDALQVGRGRWPGNAHCAVCLTFDFDIAPVTGEDAAIALEHPDRLYGARVGIHRILELLDRYDIAATFFVSRRTAEGFADPICMIARAGHEIAHASPLDEIVSGARGDGRTVLSSIEHGTEALARCTGVRPLGFRLLASEISLGALKMLPDAGYAYDSSLADDERPYLISSGSSLLVEVPVDCALNDLAGFRLGTPGGSMVSAPSQVLEIWSDEFDGCYETGGCFVLTMHPEIIGRHHRLKLLERFIQYIVRRRRRLFLTSCIEVARHALTAGAARYD